MKIEFRHVIVLFYFTLARGIETKKEEPQGSVQDFLGNLTSLLNEGNAYYANFPSYRQQNLNDDYLNAIKQHFANLQNQNGASRPDTNSQNQNNIPGAPARPDNYQFPPVRPFPPPGTGPYPPPGTGPYPPPGTGPYPPPGTGPYPPPGTGPFPPPGPGFRPPPEGRPYPPIYQPPFGSYPQYPPNSFFGALGSIARYDDLRCVPRLLCEVTANRRPDYKDEGQLPFVSREVLITLLTVLNFVDDSPILSFARAALLGYSSKGDIRACLSAYPTCPRDPDQLINYLNNHNGGFFRFFNQQLYQQPQYVPQYLKLTGMNKGIQPKQDGKLYKQDSKIYKVKSVDYRYSPEYPKFGFTSRILNSPLNIEEVPTTTQPTYFTRQPKKISFRDETAENDLHPSYNYIFPTRTGKRFSFPERSDKSIKSGAMIFPDRTGTGNLVLSSDSYGKYRIVFATENSTTKSKVRFVNDNERIMRFPEDE